MGHGDEFLRCDIARKNASPQCGIALCFQVLEERAHFLLVGVIYAAGVGVRCGFDLLCEREDYIRYCVCVST